MGLAELSEHELLKSRAMGVASKLGGGREGKSYHDIPELALRDDHVHVQASAVLAIPVFSQHASPSKLQCYCVAVL